ncbi:MAG: hypothetical protein KGS45_00255 [Planctomycetes bacterium]|nr:hypothetical protein [Planctomycetota bacterium]
MAKRNSVNGPGLNPASCRICGKPAVDIRSHIIPQFVHKWLKGGEDSFVLANHGPHISKRAKYRVREVQDQFWKRMVFCQDCEDRCEKLETYVATRIDHLSAYSNKLPHTRTRVVQVLDARKLASFLISIAVRVDAMRDAFPEFEGFDLGIDREAAIRSFQSDDPFKHGFRLIAQVPLFDGKIAAFRALPRMSPGRTGFVVWVCGRRFILKLPGAKWDDKFIRISQQPPSTGLLLTNIDGEGLIEFREFVAFLRSMAPAEHKQIKPPRQC